MKTVDEVFIKYKQPDLLKRKPNLKVCSNHIKDDFVMWGKKFIPRRIYGGSDITLACDDNGNYKRYVKPERKKKKEHPDGIKHREIKGVREAEGSD